MSEPTTQVAEHMAAVIAESSSEVQAAFLNRFAHVLTVLCRGRIENQLCYIGEWLNGDTAKMLTELVEFHNLHVEGQRSKIEAYHRKAEYGRIMEEQRAPGGDQ